MNASGTADELPGYRPFSGLAIAALLAGIGSVLVLFTALAAMVPLVAVVLAAVALVELRRSEGRRVGRGAALAGLALALGFTAQAAGGFLVDRWVGGRRAAAAATAWVDAIREARLADAMAMCVPAALPQRGHGATSGEPAAGDVAAGGPTDQFRALPAVTALAACGRELRLPLTVRRDDAAESLWIAEVPLSVCAGGRGTVRLLVEPRIATRGREPVERWLVAGFELGE